MNKEIAVRESNSLPEHLTAFLQRDGHLVIVHSHFSIPILSGLDVARFGEVQDNMWVNNSLRLQTGSGSGEKTTRAYYPCVSSIITAIRAEVLSYLEHKGCQINGQRWRGLTTMRRVKGDSARERHKPTMLRRIDTSTFTLHEVPSGMQIESRSSDGGL